MVQMSADSLKNHLTNPLKTYLFDLIVPDPIGDGDSDTFNLRCQSTSIPGRSVGKILIPYKGSAGVGYAGKLAYTHTWDCVFVESEDVTVHDALYSWCQKIVHDRYNVGQGDLLNKKDLYLHMLSTAGVTVMRIKMIGCYPESIAEVPVSYDDEGSVMYPATWHYDRWEKVD